jgi:integrase
MPRRALPLADGATIPRTFDLRFRGLDLVPRAGRNRDRFRVATFATTVRLYNARLAFIQALHDDAKDDVLRGLNDGLFTVPELEQAYSRGARDVSILLSRRRTAEDEARAAAERERRNPPLAPLIAAYKAQWQGETQERTDEVLTRFLAALGGEKARVSDLTAGALKQYLGTLVVVREDWKKRPVGTPLAPSTINRHRTVIQGLCSSLVADGKLGHHPFANDAIPSQYVGASVPQPLSPAEVRDYLAHVREASTLYEFPLWLLMHTGVDVGEFFALRAIDVLDGSDTMWLRSTRPKTGRRTRAATRRVPVTIPQLMDWLRDWMFAYGLAGEDRLFAGLSLWKLEQAHKGAVRAIRRPSVTLKGLRHVAAIYWRKAGADLQTIQKWLGHANITSTVIYTEFGEDADWETPLATKAGKLMASLIPTVIPEYADADTTTEGE